MVARETSGCLVPQLVDVRRPPDARCETTWYLPSAMVDKIAMNVYIMGKDALLL
jgi:hypothetical protein